jgi:thiol-disulfide isomerase/thioredoxin
MKKSFGLVLFWGGVVLGAMGVGLYLRPGIVNPAMWFLVASVSLGGAAFLVKPQYRLTSIIMATLCLLASLERFRHHYVVFAEKAEYEMKVRRVTPLDLPQVAIGATAPDITAPALSGKLMSLHEHRGKVVMLVFWASWCGPCMGDVPHEIDLVKRFAGRPFVLVGVNSDTSTAQALDAVAKHSISWESYWDGQEGSIASAWGVRAWPTIYVIDDAGVIQHNDLRGDDLDSPLEKLIATAESRGRTRDDDL